MPSATAEESIGRDREAYEWLLEDPRGRRVARQLVKFAGLDEPGSIGSAESMAFDVGRRSVAVYLRERCGYLCPQSWLRFEAEHLQERQLAARASDAAKATATGGLDDIDKVIR